MRLHNPTETYVFLRDEVKRQLITLKPGETISIENHQRAAFTKYVQSFGLKWLLDEHDLPGGFASEHVEGTFSNFNRKDDGAFNAKDALAQSDSAEIAEIWKEQDTIRFTPHVSSKEHLKSTPNATDFMFIKEDSNEGEEANTEVPADIFNDELETGDSNNGAFYPALSETISNDGPDYLRNAPASEDLEDFGQTLLEDSSLAHDEEGLPDSAPCTMSELQLSTKAQLWERCDKLGIDVTGTKKDIIGRIVKYYWQVHYTNMRLQSSV